MSAYAEFARVYDALMDDFDYPGWAEYYLERIRAAGCAPKTLCDCACGTGSMSVEFARRGISVTGVDLSGEMLERAAEKARVAGVRVQLVRQDMARLTLPRPVDALTCACDGVNYLTTDAAVLRFFERAHASIRLGGALMFDISSPHKLRETIGNGFFGEERDELAYLWQNRLEGDLVTMDLTFFARRSDGLYRRFAETHVQRAHEPERLRALLAQAGFCDIRIFGDRTQAEPKPEEARVHFVAVRG